jgi:hypothetical protein
VLEVAMASLSSAVNESSFLQLLKQFPNLLGITG